LAGYWRRYIPAGIYLAGCRMGGVNGEGPESAGRNRSGARLEHLRTPPWDALDSQRLASLAKPA